MQQSNCKVFIGGLSYDTTDESLSNYFRQFGQIKDAIVMRTPQGQSRGFGFCVFQNAQVCQTVLKTKSHVIDNRRVDVRMALSKDEAPPPQSSIIYIRTFNKSDDGATKLNRNKIFVGGLHYQTTPNELKEYFSQYGEVETSTVVYNHDNKKSRGFGFIIFKEYSSVQQVLSITDHIIMERKVEVKKAIPKDLDESSTFIQDPAKSFSETPKPKPSAYYPPRFPSSTYSSTLYDYSPLSPLYASSPSTSLWSTQYSSPADVRPHGFNESLLSMHPNERHFGSYSMGSSLGVGIGLGLDSYGESLTEPSLFPERTNGLDQGFW